MYMPGVPTEGPFMLSSCHNVYRYVAFISLLLYANGRTFRLKANAICQDKVCGYHYPVKWLEGAKSASASVSIQSVPGLFLRSLFFSLSFTTSPLFSSSVI